MATDSRLSEGVNVRHVTFYPPPPLPFLLAQTVQTSLKTTSPGWGSLNPSFSLSNYRFIGALSQEMDPRGVQTNPPSNPAALRNTKLVL